MSDSSKAGSTRPSSNSTASSTTAPATTSTSKAQTFPLAHPPPKASQCLRLSPRLLLQIQQLTPSSRIIPVLEIYQPSRLGKSVPNGQPKLHARDMFLTQSESYSHIPGSDSANATEGAPPTHDFVGAIYADPKRTSGAGVYIPAGNLKWEATQTPRGYRFQLKRGSAPRPASQQSVGDGTAAASDAAPPPSRGQEGGQCPQEPLNIALDWERRARTSSDETTDANANAGSSGNNKPDRFVLTIADQPHLRRPWLATLTKKGFMVGGWDRGQRAFLTERLGVQDEQVLYTCFLALGVYVARSEGWAS
ncbi:uncharacterized protein KD926_003733 [Aspergillus affinis]|uniref:uncharacterized protein n=1 Tax=Aspergillus affinis TaxID=1070780 RepID=UPI0022FEB205|nr:uncharacterized protein KD926_003733 [Aspergillus affinis]KAI9035343.1 hypothetical protein KD926_003733 [Aspergillus affinis]